MKFARRMFALLATVMLLLMMFVLAQGRTIDIQGEVSNILRQHNDERRRVLASNMLEMTWDENLARKATEHVGRCNYRRPFFHEHDGGSNLFCQNDFIYGSASVHRFVNAALRSWVTQKNHMSDDYDFGAACSYAQIISAQTSRVGCAAAICGGQGYNNPWCISPTLFFCFYSSRVNLRSSFPYRHGSPCSECPRDTVCWNGLCATGRRPEPNNQGPHGDTLTADEVLGLTHEHNKLRETYGRHPLEWDPYLEKWAKRVLTCQVDYPGPQHSYTNFARLKQGESVLSVFRDWSREGNRVNERFDHGCRTPRDDTTQCNHLTNVLQSRVTSLGCASKDCMDGTRQLVCVYNRYLDRGYYEANPNQQTHRPYNWYGQYVKN